MDLEKSFSADLDFVENNPIVWPYYLTYPVVLEDLMVRKRNNM
jgi:hypothetical protein